MRRVLPGLPSSRSSAIDLLRGTCIVLVVTHHLAIRVPLRGSMLDAFMPSRALDAFSSFGYEAVFVFFVISGFLITVKAIERWPTLGQPKFQDFYVRRVRRIAPLLFTLVAILSVLDIAGVRDYTIDASRQSLPRAIIAALGMHLNWYEGRTGYLPGNWDVLWSLSVEEAFYLGFPFVALLARRSTATLAAPLAILALSLPFARGVLAGNEIWQEKAYLPGMAAIAMGVLAALVSRSVSLPPGLARLCTLVGAFICLAILFFEDLIWPRLGETTMLLLTAGAATLLLGVHLQPHFPSNIAGLGWLRRFGRLSYEVYLSHMAVVFAAVRLFHLAGGSVRWSFLLYPPVVAATLAVGWVVNQAISHRFGSALFRTSTSPA